MNVKYTPEMIESAVARSNSWIEVCSIFGSQEAMSKHFKRMSVKYGIDFSHFNTSRKHREGRVLLADVLSGKVKTEECPKRLRVRLVQYGYKEEQCEICLRTEWNNSKIPLEVHHIDGSRANNILENLQILCANCHGVLTVQQYTPRKVFSCPDCGDPISQYSKRCRKCSSFKQKTSFRNERTKINWPENSELVQLVERSGYLGAGRQLGVSGSSIRGRLERQNLKAKSPFERQSHAN